MSGKISNVLMHPQDRKRLNLEEGKTSTRNQANTLRVQKSFKTVRSQKGSSLKAKATGQMSTKRYDMQTLS